MNLWTWMGEGATLISLLSFAMSCSVLIRSYQPHWRDAEWRRRFRMLCWGAMGITGAILLFNLRVQVWRYSGGG